MIEYVAQKLIYNQLNGNIAAGVYDDPPFLPEGAVDTDFPFVLISESRSVRFDNDSHVGKRVEVIIHIWSRYPGMKEVQELMGSIEALLNRATLSEAGYNVVDCLNTETNTLVDPDGRTRHGVTRYDLTIQQTS